MDPCVKWIPTPSIFGSIILDSCLKWIVDRLLWIAYIGSIILDSRLKWIVDRLLWTVDRSCTLAAIVMAQWALKAGRARVSPPPYFESIILDSRLKWFVDRLLWTVDRLLLWHSRRLKRGARARSKFSVTCYARSRFACAAGVGCNRGKFVLNTHVSIHNSTTYPRRPRPLPLIPELSKGVCLP